MPLLVLATPTSLRHAVSVLQAHHCNFCAA